MTQNAVGTSLADQSDDTIGGRISLAREALELSALEAATILKVRESTWSDWERDRCAPPPQMLGEIAGCLQVTLYWLLTGRGIGPTWQDLLEMSADASGRCWQAGKSTPFAELFFLSDRLTARR